MTPKRTSQSMARIVKSNSIIEAKYKLTVREQKLLLYMISHLKRGDKEFQNYVIFISDIQRVINTKDTKWGNVYREFKDIVLSLKSKPFVLLEGDRQLILNWLDTVSMIERDGRITFRFTEELKPYLLQLKENFTSYGLGNVLHLKSSYSIRLYELLKQYEAIGRREFKLERLRELMGIEKGSVERYSNFKRLALEKAKKELAKNTDIRFDYEEIKKGRKIVAIRFDIRKNEGAKPKPVVPAFLETEEQGEGEETRAALMARMTAAGVSLKDAESILKRVAAGLPEAYIQEKVALLEGKRKAGKVDSPAGFLYQAIKDDYAAPPAAKRSEGRPAASRKAAADRRAKESQRQEQQRQERQYEARQAVCSAILEEAPGLLEELLEETCFANPLFARVCSRNDSPRSNYEKALVRARVNAALAARFPERFASVSS